MDTGEYISIRKNEPTTTTTNKIESTTEKENSTDKKQQDESYGIDMSLNKIQKIIFRCFIIIVLLILTTIAVIFLTGIVGYTCYFCISCYQYYMTDYFYEHLPPPPLSPPLLNGERGNEGGECNNKFLFN